MSVIARRRSATFRFLGGVVLAVLVGCALAAVDLWGGVRALGIGPRLLGALVVGSVVLLVSGGVGWVLSWPTAERARRAGSAVAALAVVSAVVGGGLFAYYAARLRTSSETCRAASCATTRPERERLLDEGLGPLFPVIDPSFDCIALERERRDTARENVCPTVPLEDTPCRCGTHAWSARSAARCTSGRRTTCELRGGGAPTLGCATDYVNDHLRCDR